MRLPPPRILRPGGYGEGLVVDMLDLHGDVIQSCLLRRVNEGFDGKPSTSMLECDVLRHAFVTTFRIREKGQVKREWFDGGTWVGPGGKTRFFDILGCS